MTKGTADISHVAVVGVGGIGASWSALAAASGFEVAIHDSNPEVLHGAKEHITQLIDDVSQLRVLPQNVGTVTVCPQIEDAVRQADLVHEATLEDLPVKRSVLSAIETAAPDNTIITSSTSTFPVQSMARSIRKKGRFMILHPMHPPHLLPVVEISGAASTDPKHIERAESYVHALGNVPLRVKRALPGFVVNRLQAALLTEAMRLIASGACAPEDIDNAVRFGLARRWTHIGPLKAAAVNTVGGFRAFGHRMGEMMVWMGRQNNNLKPWSDANIGVVDSHLGSTKPEEIRDYQTSLARISRALSHPISRDEDAAK